MHRHRAVGRRRAPRTGCCHGRFGAGDGERAGRYLEPVLDDTIHAVASPPGGGARAVLRLSGPDARRAAATVFGPAPPAGRAQVEGHVEAFGRRLPALALWMPGPASYTGEDVVELHVPGSPALVAELQRAMAAALGARLRPARPGEFTARACRNGRLDLLQAEGVLLLIHGADRAATAAGAAWLGGGLSAAVQRARAALQDALALVETGLDFEVGETGEVPDAAWRTPIAAADAALHLLARSVPAIAVGGEVLLVGPSNAGKSSLCNALAGRDAVLVDAAPGTTRDLVRVEVVPGLALWDAAGDLDAPHEIDRRALELRDRLGAQAAAALLVVDPDAQRPVAAPPVPLLAVVCTHADRGGTAAAVAPWLPSLPWAASLPRFQVGNGTGAGIAALREFLIAHAGAGAGDAGAPIRDAIQRAQVALAAAAAASAPELVSVDLQAALAALGEIDGRHGPEDVLDRIYGRFCLGK
ncbi:MAG: GTPase [Planctomycetota bacterium]